jgi:hypothetical protein
LTWADQGTYAVEIAYSRRTSDIVYDRYNSSVILSATNFSTPSPQNITASDLFDGLEMVFFGFDISQPSQVADIATSNGLLLTRLASTIASSSQIPYAPGVSLGGQAYTYFVGILTMTVLLFQPNWLNPFDLGIPPTAVAPDLPPDLYISVDLSTQTIRAIIPKWSVIVYLIVSLAVYFWCVGGMFLALSVQTPPTSPFQLIDFSSRVVANDDETSVSHLLSETWSGSSGAIRQNLASTRLYLRKMVVSAVDGSEKIGLSTG